MNVYVEYVLLDNFCLDFVILYLATLTLKLNVKWLRIALGSLVGSLCALITVFVQGVWLYVVKTLCLVLMCIATVGFGKKLFWHILTTCAYTFVMGGAIIGLFNLGQNTFVVGAIYQNQVPLFVFVIAIAFVAFLCVALCNYVKQIKHVAPFLTKVVVSIDKPHKVVGFCDSGNNATFNDLPVCFVSKKFSKEFATCALLGKTQTLQITTIAGQTSVIATLGKLTINSQTHQVYFALAKTNALYDVILSNQFCGGTQ